MTDSLKIECPFCKTNAEMIHLEIQKTNEKDLEKTKTAETLVWQKISSSKMVHL